MQSCLRNWKKFMLSVNRYGYVFDIMPIESFQGQLLDFEKEVFVTSFSSSTFHHKKNMDMHESV